MTSLERVHRRSRREWLATALLLCGMLAYAALVYVLVVLAGGALLGRTSASPDVALSVVATAVIALTFDRVQSALDAFTARAVHGGQVSPYDVLRQFSESVTGQYPAEELPSRMARLLAQGTGVEWAQVWLLVGDEPTLAATWPPQGVVAATGPWHGDPRAVDEPGRRHLEVRQGGDLLGVLVVQEHPQVQLTPVEERLFSGLAGQAGLVLRGASLRTDLHRRALELSARVRDLRESRQRLVDAQDAERRLLERDIHDGAQQHLVALAVNLRLAQTIAQRTPDRAISLLGEQEEACHGAVDTLIRLARGIYPTTLADEGLAAAVEAAATASPVPVAVSAAGLGRFASRVEAAAYFCCLEAMQNAAKHARATAIHIELRTGGDGELVAVIADDGRGFDYGAVTPGAGLTNMRDRLGSLDGTLTVESTSRGTRVCATVPVGAGV